MGLSRIRPIPGSPCFLPCPTFNFSGFLIVAASSLVCRLLTLPPQHSPLPANQGALLQWLEVLTLNWLWALLPGIILMGTFGQCALVSLEPTSSSWLCLWTTKC